MRDVRACGLDALQLDLEPLRRGAWQPERTRDLLAGAGLVLLSGMMGMQGEDYSSLHSIRRTGGVVPDATWADNLRAARENATLARGLGLDLVSFHAGFLPHDRADPARATLLERLGTLVDVFADQGLATAFESGQERAATLLEVLAELDRPSAGVNLDPANMILYDVDEPVPTLRRLAPHVRQIHIKDARRTQHPGQWGEEVPVGAGAVPWDAFFAAYRELPRAVDLVIEREAGEARVADVVTARDRVLAHVGDLLQPEATP